MLVHLDRAAQQQQLHFLRCTEQQTSPRAGKAGTQHLAVQALRLHFYHSPKAESEKDSSQVCLFQCISKMNKGKQFQ